MGAPENNLQKLQISQNEILVKTILTFIFSVISYNLLQMNIGRTWKLWKKKKMRYGLQGFSLLAGRRRGKTPATPAKTVVDHKKLKLLNLVMDFFPVHSDRHPKRYEIEAMRGFDQ